MTNIYMKILSFYFITYVQFKTCWFRKSNPALKLRIRIPDNLLKKRRIRIAIPGLIILCGDVNKNLNCTFQKDAEGQYAKQCIHPLCNHLSQLSLSSSETKQEKLRPQKAEHLREVGLNENIYCMYIYIYDKKEMSTFCTVFTLPTK